MKIHIANFRTVSLFFIQALMRERERKMEKQKEKEEEEEERDDLR